MSSVAIASLNPAPSAPSSASAATVQRSNRRRASGCGAMTCSRSAMRRPGVAAGTSSALMPRAPVAAASLRANTV